MKAIDKLIGEEGIYPSRSELIRVAVREFLVKELEAAQAFTSYQKQTPKASVKKTVEEPFVDGPQEIENFFFNSSRKIQ